MSSSHCRQASVKRKPANQFSITKIDDSTSHPDKTHASTHQVVVCKTFLNVLFYFCCRCRPPLLIYSWYSSTMPPNGAGSGTGKKRNAFTMKRKLEAILFAEKTSNCAAAKKFNVDRKQIQNWRELNQPLTRR